jgi:hypothetical protein
VKPGPKPMNPAYKMQKVSVALRPDDVAWLHQEAEKLRSVYGAPSLSSILRHLIARAKAEAAK